MNILITLIKKLLSSLICQFEEYFKRFRKKNFADRKEGTMKTYIQLFVLFLLSMQAFASEPDVLQSFVEANKKFTADVYREINKHNHGNVLICPLSAEIILGLVRFGAKGNTAKELALHLHNNDNDTKKMFVELNKNLNANDKYILSNANNVFLDNKYVIRDEFKSIAYDDFNAGVQNVDFSKIQETVEYINLWVENKTQQKIKKLLSSEQLSSNTAAVLVNSLYFHGNWVNQFDKHGTFKNTFYINEQLSAETDMMSTKTDFNYYESNELNAQFLEMPFEGDDVTMTIVLPKTRFGLNNLENQIFEVLLPLNYKNVEVEVVIPKFKIESNINFKPVLQSMGVKDAFTNKADFSGISTSTPPLLIDQIIQKTFLEINEKGATAAASTAIMFSALSLPQHRFHANHPFLYYIKHKTGGIMFIGKFVAPTN
ncbi:hypothetical protein RN001_005204 [Aquatica leii]|uniref:Serpin domain-containing protein n=1 Tax=Aquatica leii TaxID=1421715 RepID=A0AAN7Q6G1_9COLE|nr:hypothetical protein RN001_005204 [Aquatica leii]